MKNVFSQVLVVILFLCVSITKVEAKPTAKNNGYFELKVYHFTNSQQEATVDSFLQYKYLPFLHGAGYTNIGVFKPIANDTATDKKIYVFTPFKSLKQWEGFQKELESADVMTDLNSYYVNVPYNQPAYSRIETIFLKAFDMMPPMAASQLKGPRSERVYELRSYEGASEKYHKSKVKMFNEGGEIEIFDRLKFNPVFYSKVIFGSRMPNLMYMTSFENMKTRDELWKVFFADPAFKALGAMAEYKNNVSRNETIFLRSTEFSDL